jgi:hypothetical protein
LNPLCSLSLSCSPLIIDTQSTLKIIGATYWSFPVLSTDGAPPYLIAQTHGKVLTAGLPEDSVEG